MKKLIPFILLAFLFSCKNENEEYKKPENALDAGREFIDNSLKGRFNTARKYMLQDDDNLFWMEKVSNDYNKMSEQDKAGLGKASINIIEVADLADSVTIINYSNSYKKRPQKVKVVNQNGNWLVDFKYTFTENPQQ
jgi:hypothetical protein